MGGGGAAAGLLGSPLPWVIEDVGNAADFLVGHNFLRGLLERLTASGEEGLTGTVVIRHIRRAT